MFGLSQREQRWKAEKEAAELAISLAKSVIDAQVKVAEVAILAGKDAELLALREEVSSLKADIANLTKLLKPNQLIVVDNLNS